MNALVTVLCIHWLVLVLLIGVGLVVIGLDVIGLVGVGLDDEIDDDWRI